jgi:uroporphyrinogen-III synthase
MARMLVTRPLPDAEETAWRLAALDIEAVTCPLLTHRTLDTGLPEATGFAAIVFTSANSLRALEERGALGAYLGLKAYAVGDRTAAAAREHGFADVESAGGSFADMVELLAHAELEGPVFYPAAQDHRGDLGKSLAPFGAMAITTHVYAMEPVEDISAEVVEALGSGAIAAGLFYSRRTAETFVRLCGSRLDRAVRTRFGALCLSEAVAEPLLDAHFVRVGLADNPSEDAMMGLALSFARDQNAS